MSGRAVLGGRSNGWSHGCLLRHAMMCREGGSHVRVGGRCWGRLGGGESLMHAMMHAHGSYRPQQYVASPAWCT